MSRSFLASKTIAEFNEPGIRQTQALPTAVSLFVGVTERGPINEPTSVKSWSEYREKFGSFTADSFTPNGVYGFFENGGADAYVIRVVHFDGAGNPATAAKSTATLNATGRTPTLKVDALSEGTWGDSLTVSISDATDGDAAKFDLSVTDGRTTEVYPNVSMDDASDAFVETAINEGFNASTLIRVEDQDAGGTPTTDKPINGDTALAGGDNGLASLADADFLDDSSGTTALKNAALSQIAQVDLVAIPGRTGAAIYNGLIDFCENDREELCFAVLDPTEASTASGFVATMDGIISENAGVYWPQIKVRNPNKTVFGNDDLLVVPPSGYMMGVYARNDQRLSGGGLYTSPAGEAGKIRGALGFENNEVLDVKKRDLLYPKRINPINRFEGVISADGGRTLKATGSFPHIMQKRGVIFAANTIKAGVEYARHKPNNDELRDAVNRTITTFLVSQMNLGAFASRDPSSAFTVNTGEDLNPPSIVSAGKMIIEVGLAFNFPAEFIVIRFSQDTRALENEIGA